MFSSNATQVSNVNYIEDVFSTYLYTGNSSTQTITNGIDLAGKGGLVWVKERTSTSEHWLIQSVNTAWQLATDSSHEAYSNSAVSLDSAGFSLQNNVHVNESGQTYASWTFRKQPKFFDVVTTTSQTVSHSLASVAGFVIWKRTNASEDWNVLARKSDGSYVQLNLNLTDGAFASYANASAAGITSTNITLPSFTTGGTYVVYLYAHNAGGFGLTGTDNVISCGSFTTAGSGGKMTAPVNLGYEPQWLLAKNVDSAENWVMYDIMRGMNNTGYAALNPNTSGAEYTGTSAISPTATGFDTPNASGPFANSATYIYIAIRRGPMKVPTSGTSVFQPASFTSTASRQTMGSLPVVDMFMGRRTNSIKDWGNASRLTGEYMLKPNLTDAQDAMVTGYGDSVKFDIQNGSSMITSGSGDPFITYNFHRAPSFFDEVCYTGTGSATTFSHNLGVAPELMIVKGRTNTFSWFVYQKDLTSANESFLTLNTDSSATSGSAVWNSTSPTSSVFSVGSANAINQSGNTYVAYLFATCAGVSKVGSYTGTGTTLQVDCGFTGGARFVLIKRTDSTGDWYVWDSARGIVSGNDPYLLLNSTAAEVTSTDYVDTYSAGFEISSTAPAAINASGGSFIFLAIS